MQHMLSMLNLCATQALYCSYTGYAEKKEKACPCSARSSDGNVYILHVFRMKDNTIFVFSVDAFGENSFDVQ